MVARTGESGGIYQASIQSTSRAVDEARARRWTGTDEAEAEREVRMEEEEGLGVKKKKVTTTMMMMMMIRAPLDEGAK